MTADTPTLKLTAWKNALIDLTRRNPLISLPAARSLVRLSDAADELWKLGATGPKRLWLLSEKIPGTEQIRTLQTRQRAVGAAEFKTLNNLRLKARLSLHEQGVNVLFLVLGVLEWYDPRIGAAVRSPLLLLPVTLEPLPASDGFVLSRLEEEPRVNPTLRYRLAQPDLNLHLPETDPDDDAFTPSGYLDSVAEVIAHKPGWKVVPSDCLLGRFSYLNLVMYEELDQRLDEMRQHPVIAALAGDTVAAQALAPKEEPPALDTQPPQQSFHVLPADPSQERAILAARHGQSLVIQGPPGTGKTQTITNLIATCIADGKRVLFVSEKMAALEAVYSRLQTAQLAGFCLEAHSHKAKKQEVLEQLRAALDEDIRTTPPRLAEMSVLATLRDEANRAVSALHQTQEPLGISAYEARGIVAELDATPEHYFVLDGLEDVDADAYHVMQKLAERLASFHDLFPRLENHPWRGLLGDRFSQELYTQARDTVTDLLQTTDALEDQAARLWRLLQLPEQDSAGLRRADTDWLTTVVKQMQQTPYPPSDWLTEQEGRFSALRDLAVTTQQRYRDFQNRKTTLLSTFAKDILDLPHAELAARMGGRHKDVLETAFGTNWAGVSDAAFAQADTALADAVTGIQRLGQSTHRLGSLCGIPTPETFTQALRLEQLAVGVLGDPKPQPGWFTLGSIAALRSRAKEAQSWHQGEESESAILTAVYTDQLYSLDLPMLRQRFESDYASWTRVFKKEWYADRRLLKSVLLPEATLKGRSLTDDLRRACRVVELRALLARDKDTIQADFGGHYQQAQTDWSVLYAALDQTQAVIDLLSGNVPPVLQRRLIMSGAAIDEIREQESLVSTHLQATDRSLETALQRVRLSGAVACLVSQIPFAEITAEWGRVREAIADFVAARQVVRATHRQQGQTEAAVESLRNGLRGAAWVVQEDAVITRESEALRERYVHLFDGLETDWTSVLTALDHAERLRRTFANVNRPIPAPIVAAISGALGSIVPDAQRLADEIRRLHRELERVWGELLRLFDGRYLRTADGLHLLEAAPFSEQRAWAEVRLSALGELERWLNFEDIRKQCARHGLLSFCEVMVRRVPPAEEIPNIFRKAFHQRWLDTLAVQVPSLGALCAAEHGKDRARFEQMDRALIASTPNRIRALMKQQRDAIQNASVKTGELGALKRILSQRRPRASVRKILSDIPNLLFKLKPCLMMSPLSVSLFLDPDRIQFDIVVFDEASQIFPEYALGPLLRASQAVIAGDSRQLPPTSFFKGMQDDGASEDDEEAVLAADAREFESVLEAATVPLAETNLTWHYRSRHESLIDFSNRTFYHHGLKTFPSSRLPSVVSLHHVPDGVYYGGQGNARNNPVEARVVADLVVEQVRAQPNVSVGVITMSEAQQECIRTEIEKRTKQDATLAKLLNEDRLDGFFIKNIENVQGDERDVIFLSIGYGRWADGKVRMLFGPLNRAGGERRLNVAITRARERLTVVSSLLPEDLRGSDADGPRLLQEYLSFARAATDARVGGTDGPVGDALVEAVAIALEARGHAVRRRVGLSDYRLDLAVVDPENPERFLLGVECDSENYRSGETARAREWLRASVLTNLGWSLHRVWSADWIGNKAVAVQQLEQAISAAKAGEALPPPIAGLVNEVTEEALVGDGEEAVPSAPTADSTAEAVLLSTSVKTETPASTSNGGVLPGLHRYEDASALELSGGALTLYGTAPQDGIARAELIDKIVQVEAPVHAEVLAQRLCRAAGLRQTGPKIKRLADDAVALLSQAGRIKQRGDFVWAQGAERALPRVPPPGTEPRPIDYVCKEEIGEVALVILKNAIGMRIEEAVNETARTLGYERTGTAIRERIEEALAQLEYDARIHNFNGQLRTLEE